MTFNTFFSPQRIAIIILALAVFVFIGSAGYRWYSIRSTTFLSGAPPADLMDSIEPKYVSPERMKSPAITNTDIFLAGSPTSSIGIVFYADYTNPDSNKLLKQIIQRVSTYNGEIRVILRYLPETTKNRNPSFEAVVLSECSRIMDPNWSAHESLLAIDKENTKISTIEQISFDYSDTDGMIYGCRNDSSLRNRLTQDIQQARGDGILAAPFVFAGTKALPADQANLENIFQAINTYMQ
ncbi:thioredoxin domain-containing protein [Patescibacteria group bacterium]|nr:thioredoxin domain-containing protein [Patescibacteria group bacterium]